MEYDPAVGRLRWKSRGKSRFDTRFAGKLAGYVSSTTGYRMITVDYEQFSEHQLVWFFHHGDWPIEIDHENHNRAENFIDGLREVDHSENNKNRSMSSRNKSGVNGVRWCSSRKKWHVMIGVNGKGKYVGRFDNFDEAVKARKEAEEKYGFHYNHGRLAV